MVARKKTAVFVGMRMRLPRWDRKRLLDWLQTWMPQSLEWPHGEMASVENREQWACPAFEVDLGNEIVLKAAKFRLANRGDGAIELIEPVEARATFQIAETPVALDLWLTSFQPEFGSALKRLFEEIGGVVGAGPLGRRGVSRETRRRAELYASLKAKNPEWSQAKVAMRANHEEHTDIHSEEGVRNAYRAMGWAWSRAERCR